MAGICNAVSVWRKVTAVSKIQTNWSTYKTIRQKMTILNRLYSNVHISTIHLHFLSGEFLCKKDKPSNINNVEDLEQGMRLSVLSWIGGSGIDHYPQGPRISVLNNSVRPFAFRGPNLTWPRSVQMELIRLITHHFDFFKILLKACFLSHP